MPEELTISKNAKLAKSEDFLFLKSEGLKHIEELAHKLWTDYNIHDPGIQLLEVLCYAITDLGYRTSYDVKDILSREINNVVSVKGNFYTAFHILPNNPVTFNDLRKLLIDINGVRNSWININDEVEYCLDTFHQELKDCNGTTDKVGPLNGLYDVLIEYEDYVSTGERIIRVGRHNNEGDPGTHINTGEKGINFRVFHPLVLKFVSVYATGAPGEVKIRLLAPDESTVPIAEVTHEITGDGGPFEIPLNFEIQPGRNYRLDAKGSTVKLYRNDTHEYPDGKQLLISLLGGWSGTADNNQYYFFYDWKINFSVSPLELDKLIGDDLLSNQIGLLDHFGSPGGYINTSDKGLLFDVFSPMCLDAVYVIPETTGIVRIQILDNDGLTIFENETEVNTPHESTKISIDIELNAGW
ncbi:MAG: hypothetical protein KAI29_02685, partial [Cyclobacteriaceae bacterium]|nr:hypothetical protein [Cyclobacteriaceae bacterium]